MALGSTTTRRAVAATLLSGLALSAAVGPAAARWQVHNSADVTQVLPPAGGTEAQTCTDRLAAQSGWSTYVPNSDSVDDYVPPSGSGAYDPREYEFWKAPPGYSNGSFQESDLDPGAVDFFPDDGGDPVPAVAVRHFWTPERAQIQPEYLYPDEVDTTPDGGNLYLFSVATWGALLPGVRFGELIGIKPTGGSSTFLNLRAVHCDATRLHLHLVRYDPPGPDARTDDVLNKEIVQVVNGTGRAVELGGWTLADNGGNVYQFPATRLDPGQKVTVHTGHGRDRAGHRYWGRSTHAWGNRGDRAALRDGAGTTVDSCRWAPGPGWVYC